MIWKQDRSQGTLFIPGSLDQLVPNDHILRRVDWVLGLSWLRDEVRYCHDESIGQPRTDREAAVRVMLAGFFHGIVHDQTLIPNGMVNPAVRWPWGHPLEGKSLYHSGSTSPTGWRIFC